MFLASPAFARTDEDDQAWLNVTVIGNVGKLAYFAEIQPRVGEDVSRMTQLLLRPAIGYQLSPTVTLYGGYAHVVLPIENGPDRNEERLFSQLNWSLPKIAGGSMLLRTRLEHRRLSNGHDVGWRLRQMIRFMHPLGNPKKVRALAHVEAFVAFDDTDWGAHKGFDQVRSFAGIEVPLPGRSTLDLGYLNQTINDPNNRIRINHVASATFWIRP
ncbi:DUF2490 domain-containing protein [Sphingomonas natans]|uniref:DUF2490 domain-containing protein n=1 Tax=Sphingomonas natans TaxID=3063330 RepID=UPI0026E2542B|nr:DUF2490 domain-containing protein [Sphingomonas sp. BIUV-7]